MTIEHIGEFAKEIVSQLCDAANWNEEPHKTRCELYDAGRRRAAELFQAAAANNGQLPDPRIQAAWMAYLEFIGVAQTVDVPPPPAKIAIGDDDPQAGMRAARKKRLQSHPAAIAVSQAVYPLTLVSPIQKQEESHPADTDDSDDSCTNATIPMGFRTKPMSLAEAGTRIGKQPNAGTKAKRREAAAKAMRRAMKPGGYRYFEVAGQFVFDKRQIPDK